MKQMKKTGKDRDPNVFGLVLRIFFLAVAVVYFILLIAGKWIFPADSAFYLGINIFSGTAGNVWLRSLS